MQQNNTVWEREHLQNNILRLEEYYTGETGICIANRGLVDIGFFFGLEKLPNITVNILGKNVSFITQRLP